MTVTVAAWHHAGCRMFSVSATGLAAVSLSVVLPISGKRVVCETVRPFSFHVSVEGMNRLTYNASWPRK